MAESTTKHSSTPAYLEQLIRHFVDLRAIAAADLHNLVFQQDYRIVPAVTKR